MLSFLGVRSAIFALLSETDEVATGLGCIYSMLFAVKIHQIGGKVPTLEHKKMLQKPTSLLRSNTIYFVHIYLDFGA